MRDQSYNRTIAVIGGGAAGMMAAAAAAENADCRVLLFDCNDRLGRKIYATGNGRCNLTNLDMRDDCYNVPVLERLAAFDAAALMQYFRDRGVYLHDRNGYVYPRTDQAATIVDALERELRSHENVEIRLAEPVLSIEPQGDRYALLTQCDRYAVDRAILAAGGLVSKTYGCGPAGLRIAETLGHTVTTLAPALVPVHVEDPLLKVADGVRCQARVTAVVDSAAVATDVGEVQVTKAGFSGIPVFQISRHLSLALEKGQKAEIEIDFVPELPDDAYIAEIHRRQQDPAVVYVRDVTAGLVNSKIGSYIARRSHLVEEQKVRKLEDANTVIAQQLVQLRSSTYTVTGTAGYDKAQVTTGGVPLEEVDSGFQSVVSPGLYLCGELLDVDGICGGYNLTFAMCSGYIAGRNASC